MNLAENIQILRKSIGASQEELAEKCNVSRQAIAKWENGESIPTIEKIIFLADLFEISLDEIVGRKPIDKYNHFLEYIKEHAANDIPRNEEDGISEIVTRYLLFAESVGLRAEDKIRGLQEIFLYLSSENE